MINVFLSGASRELGRVERMADELAGSGLVQLLDPWWVGAEAWSGKDAGHTRTAAQGYAAAHELAMRRAHVFWLLWPRQGSHGALYELGYASALRWHDGPSGALLVVTGHGAADTIYTAAADWRLDSDEIGLVHVLRLAQGVR